MSDIALGQSKEQSQGELLIEVRTLLLKRVKALLENNGNDNLESACALLDAYTRSH